MGMFSEKKTYVESFSMPLVADTPNYVQQSVTTSIHGERPITEDLIANMLRGLGTRLGSYYRYGKNNYAYGLPTSSFSRHQASTATVQAVVQVVTGSKAFIDYSIYESANALLFAQEFLVTSRGYDIATEEITEPPFTTSEVVTLLSTEFTSDTEILITYSTGDTEILTLEEPVLLGEDYYHVSYYKYLSTGQVDTSTRYWWQYAPVVGTYPTLEPEATEESLFYPIVPLRIAKEDRTIDDGSDEYKTSKKLLKRLDLDITELGEGVHANPDIDDVDHAYVIMGVTTQTESNAGKAYLYEFFKYAQSNSSYTEDDYLSWASRTRDYVPPLNSLHMEEEGTGMKTELGWLYITSELVEGSIGKRGSVETETDILPAGIVTEDDDDRVYRYAYERSKLIIRKQISSELYDEVVIHGLKHINYIYKTYTVDTTLEDAVDSAEDEDTYTDGMIIPLHDSVMRKLSLAVRTELGYEAIRIVFNCKVVQKLKWYQTSFFQFVVIVVAMVITVASMGSMAESLYWAAGLVGSTSIAVGFVVYAAIQIAVQYGIAYLIDAIGIEAGFVLAVIAIASTLSGNTGVLSPEAMAMLQSGIIQGNQLAMDWQMDNLLDEYTALQEAMDAGQQLLDELSADLNTTGYIDPMALADSRTGLALPSETPEQYYATRIHLGNMAPFATMAVDNFVSNNLKLEGVTTHYGIKV